MREYQIFDTKEELFKNRKIVTASKIGAILGHSPYDNPKKMWEYETGRATKFFTPYQKASMERGNEQENNILDWFEKEIEATQRFDQPFFEWNDMSATPDSVMFRDIERIVEAKSTAQTWQIKRLDTTFMCPPLMYVDQIIFQMIIADIYIGHLVWSEHATGEMFCMTIRSTPGYNDWVIDMAEKFMWCVKEEIPFEVEPYKENHPMVHNYMFFHDFTQGEQKLFERAKKEVKHVLQTEHTVGDNVWEWKETVRKSYTYKTTKLKETFADSLDLLELCRNEDQVSRSLVCKEIVDE